jgi:SAM-dependent methyltransferase
MELSEAIELIRPAHPVAQASSRWADLGCGSGLFTGALASLLAPGSTLFAVDKLPVNIAPQLQPAGRVFRSLQLDFVADPLPFSALDGILMANSLHYVRDKPALIGRLSDLLGPEGCFLIVEYDTDRPVAPWMPYPLGFEALRHLFAGAGFGLVHKSGERPSAFGRANIYAAWIKR